MAIPVVCGRKSEGEKFAGALRTFTMEAMMPDGKALQAGTSHNLGQNFAKAFGTEFQNREGGRSFVWQTSWGVSTRLIGSLIMSHGDDKGLVLPPRMAPIHVVIVPIFKTDEERVAVFSKAKLLCDNLKAWPTQAIELGSHLQVHIDLDESKSPGWKFSEWEVQGVPLRIELGPKDLSKGSAVLARRDNGEKISTPFAEIPAKCVELLGSIQESLLARATENLKSKTFQVDSWQDFESALENGGGFLSAHWDGTLETERAIKEKSKATIRCIPLNNKQESGTCILTGKPSSQRVLFARAY